MNVRMTESEAEQAALTWLKSLGWVVKHGREIASGVLAAGREGRCVVLLRNASTMCCRLRRDRNS